jgi:hypothetical protein
MLLATAGPLHTETFAVKTGATFYREQTEEFLRASA